LFADLAELVAQETMPVIVIGDFNATPWSYAFKDFSSETGLVNSQNGYGLDATWPSTFPVTLVPLDHMLHSDSLTTVTRKVGPDLGSDHLPLLVEVSRSAG
jgi:endonuclease/exonuclease/phosphatase (EEP) superfamily protein YafD